MPSKPKLPQFKSLKIFGGVLKALYNPEAVWPVDSEMIIPGFKELGLKEISGDLVELVISPKGKILGMSLNPRAKLIAIEDTLILISEREAGGLYGLALVVSKHGPPFIVYYAIDNMIGFCFIHRIIIGGPAQEFIKLLKLFLLKEFRKLP